VTTKIKAPRELPAGPAGRLPRGAVWRRFRGDRTALAGLAIVAVLVLIAVAAPLFTAFEGQDATTFHPALLDSARGGVPRGSFGGANADHWLGVEPRTGRDVFARAVYGARISLLVAIGATVVEVFIGVVVGLSAGLGGRLVDGVLGRTTDLMLAFPELIFAIALLAIVPAWFPRPALLMLVIGVFGWGSTARLVRGQTLSLRSRDYVAAARLSGASRARIARREVLPGVIPVVLTRAALLVPGNMATEAGLSFLGIGVRPPTPSWGQMLSDAAIWYRADPTYVLVPATVLFLGVLGFTLAGDGLRVALDPRTTEASRKAG
jgi:peptide/nickel transport system permease protein